MNNKRVDKKSFKPAEKMPVSERAKQFMPFAALKGFEEAIAQKQREYFREEPAGLSEERLSEIGQVISELMPGDEFCATFYDGYVYTEIRDTLISKDTNSKILKGNKCQIRFFDIKNIYKL